MRIVVRARRAGQLPDHLCYNGSMARKTKKTSKSAQTTRKTKPAASRRKATGQGKIRTRKTTTSKKPPLPPLVSSLSLDRKLDIAGVILTIVGLLTLFSLISSSRSPLTASWLSILSKGFGWGVYLLPLGLFGIGPWLILRDFERIPQLALERISGIGLLYGNLLSILHFLLFAPDKTSSYNLAALGKGGGYAGAFFSEMLIAGLGRWGTVVALLAWTVIGVMLAIDVSAAELFGWAAPVAMLLKRGILEIRNRLVTLTRRAIRTSSKVPAPAGFPAASEEATFSRGEDALPTLAGSPGSRIIVTTGAEPHQWALPSIADILDQGDVIPFNDDHDRQRAQIIEETLASFGAPAHVVEINRGPTITQFGVEPDFVETRNGRTRVRVNKIASLADDLALVLAAERIRIQAPVPGRGYVGIEVPNDEIALVSLRDVIENPTFRIGRVPLRIALGQDTAGYAIATNLANMPHLLIAGATGSGKSVCVNAIISCLLLHNTPDDLRIIMVDPKRVELTNYNGIPHLLAPVVVEMERVVGALQWVTREMDARYQKFADTKTRNITGYNKNALARGGGKLPYLVVIIDELADLMMLAPDQTEKTVTRLAQLARATGIHLVIATQRPSVDVVTGLIKANFPARVAFAVSSGVDSRVILDQAGAERLLGRGDLLFQAPDAPAPVRLQGVFVSDSEILRLVQYWRVQNVRADESSPMHTSRPADVPLTGIPLRQIPFWEEAEEEENLDPMFDDAVDLIRRQGRASISMLQRRLRIGYTRAARLIETMEEKGMVGPPEGGAQTRQVLDYGPAAPPAGES
ncbi:MAG: DNA translocase FtsK 4TM domain-containing protein [Anaerolineales bacterium]